MYLMRTKPVGRPPLPQKQRRTESVRVSYTKERFVMAKRVATAFGHKSVKDWLEAYSNGQINALIVGE